MKPTLPVIVSLLATAACSAQWQLVDDFQQWEDGDVFTEATEIGWHAAASEQTDEYWMIVDPDDPDNIAMYVEPPWSADSHGTVFIQKELPDGGIIPGNTGTLFCRSYWTGFYPTWQLGTADKELAYDDVTGLQITPGAWGDFNALIRLAQNRTIEHRFGGDGGAYISTDPPVVIDFNHWYNFWLVVENTWDMSTSPPTSTGVYTLYMQGPGIGDGVSPILIPVGLDPPEDKAYIRRPPTDENGNPQAIIWVQFASSFIPDLRNWDFFLLDDFYFSNGDNLTDPLSYGGYPADGSRDTDTGDFLGWINITQAPYIWSYALNGWIYMEEPAADAPGAWGYFFK